MPRPNFVFSGGVAMKRRSFLKLIGCASAAITLEVRRVENASAQDEAILDGARERIERHRKGDVTITVRTRDGKPLSNVELNFEQRRHSFLFGCNIFRFGRIRDRAREEAYRERFAALLNYATLGFYWASYEPVRGKPNYEYTDKVLEWCKEHKITCKGHPLAWDSPASSPDGWLPDDLNEIERLSTERVHEIVKRYSGRINIWDVVNEPTDLSRFKTKMNTLANKLGAVAYTAMHLKVARNANPKATLLVNDYRIDEAYIRILQQLKDEDGKWLFDAVGIQSHMHGGVWPPAQIWRVCERFSKLGLPLHFTETTIVSGERIGNRWGETTKEGEERQANSTVLFYTILFSHPAVQAITWWDFSDDGAWQGAPAGWLRRDMSPKPVYERLMELIKGEWWTKEKGVTDGNGVWRTRAFFGDYELTIRTQSGVVKSIPVTAQQGRENKFEVVL